MTLVQALGLVDTRLVALVGAGGKTSLMFALTREFVDTGESVLLTTTTRLAADEAAGPWPEIVATAATDVIDAALRPAGAILVHAGVDATAGKALGLDPYTVDRVAGSGAFNRIVVEADGTARRPLKVPAVHEPVIPETADAVVAVAGMSAVGRSCGESVFRIEMWSRLTGLAKGDIVTAESVSHAANHPEGLAKGAPSAARRVLLLNQADTPDRIAAGHDIAHRLAAMGSRSFATVVIARLRPGPEIADIIVLDPEIKVPR